MGLVDFKEIQEQVKKRVEKTEKTGGGGGPGQIEPDFIRECLGKNELGDGDLFKKLYREDFLFNKSMDSWLQWAGHHWVVDKMDAAAASVDGVAQVYHDEAERLWEEIKALEAEKKSAEHLKNLQKNLNMRVSALRSSRRRKNCLLFAHTSKNPLAIDGTEIDQQPWLLPCANGVINLKTGDIEPGRQSDYLIKASPIPFPDDGINVDMSGWEGPLLEIFSGRQDLVDFLRHLCGSALVGRVMQSIFVVMTGKGANGKSMIVKAISDVLGPLAGTIRSEMLLDQHRVASSAGPTPDIMALRGLRMAFASETDDGCRVSGSRIKWLTGADTITGRNPHDKYEVSFEPTHTLVLLTNHLPRANAEDFAFWRRMIVIPFDLSFIVRQNPDQEMAANEREADPELPKKLQAHYPEILAWMVKGCLEWQKNGHKLIQPAAVKAAIHEYRSHEDSVGDFIDECCITGDHLRVRASDVYEKFEEWWQTNVSNKIPKQKRFGEWFSARFEKEKSGRIYYRGVGLRSELDDVDH